MVGLTILSPHRDDAVFSLAIALSRWSALGRRIRVVNFFTQTQYAPHAFSNRVATVSALRRREDYSALSSIDKRIKIESFGLLDAPLRLGISPTEICAPETARLQAPEEIVRISTCLRKYFAGLVLAPLALGDHVDHLFVRSAAVRNSVHGRRLGFYEDLPYATWTSVSSLNERVRCLEKQLRSHLRPAFLSGSRTAIADKFRLIRRYQSQITRGEAQAMANFAWRYRGGERIWIPKYASAWKPFLS